MKNSKKYYWAYRWYNKSEFNRQFLQLSIFNTNPEVIDLEDVNHTANPVQGCNADESDVNSNAVCIETNNSNEFTVQNTVLENGNTVVLYKDILGVATDLCRTVSEEQTLCKSVYVPIKEWISKLRAGDQFQVIFII